MDLAVLLYSALLLLVVLVVLAGDAIRYFRRRTRLAQEELLDVYDRLYESRKETQLALRCADGYKRVLAGCRAFYAKDAAVTAVLHRQELQRQADQHDHCNIALLTDIGVTDLAKTQAEVLAEAWKSYAIAYEVLCETVAEHDAVGSAHASAAVADARRTLDALGQYDA